MKSWADIVNKNNSLQGKNLTENAVKQAIRLVNEEERRSKNRMFHGCPEKVDGKSQRSCFDFKKMGSEMLLIPFS